MAKKVKLPGRVESAEVGGIVTGAGEILDDEKGKVQSVINSEVDAELVRLENEKQDNITVDGVPTEGSGNPVSSGAVYTADKALSDAIEAILLLIPSAASSLNQLADKTFVRDSIDTSTATFRGTFNVVSDLHLSASATHAQIEAALNALSLGADTNDYCFVQVPDSESTENIKVTERYKFNGTGWAYEYDLNNSGFTSDQWAAINSNITALLVTKLSQLPTADALAALFAGKQDSLTFDDEPTAGSNNPVKSGGLYVRDNQIVALINALDAAKQDKLTFDSTPINGSSNPVTSGGIYEAIYLVQVTLAGLDGRLVNAESAITVLTENVGILRTLYQALNQSDIIVGALPSTGVANTVYRVPGTSSYADWMYYDGAWVKLAEYTTLDGYLYKGIATPSSSPAASANKIFYFALTAGTYTNFGNLVVTEGISILKYDGANWTQDKISYMDGGVFDVTAYSGSEFTSLSALLSDANLNNLIPTAVRKGGMSIKFVESSDNKYVQYRLMADSWSTVVTDWSFCGDDVLVENPEWIYVLLDAEKKILAGIKSDGSVEWSIGVPTPVKTYINNTIAEIKNGTERTDIDGINKIIAFLSEFSTNDTLKDLLDTKVDKEEGKSLVEAEYADGVHYIENPEFVEVKLDSENKIIWAIKTDGGIYYGAGVPGQIQDELRQKAGVEELNRKVDKEIGKSLIGSQFADSCDTITNPEFLKVITDKDGVILAGLKIDGAAFFAKMPQLDSIKQDLETHKNSFLKNQEGFNTESRLIPYSKGTQTPAIDYAPGYNRLIIGFMTDNHIDLGEPGVSIENVKNAIDFFNNTKVPISCIIEGGDIITQYDASKSVYKEMMRPFFDVTWGAKMPFLFTKGNHDINAIGVPPSSVLNEDDWDAVWFGRAENQYGIVRKTKANGKKSGYYYYDIPAFKVRIISLNCYDLDFSKIDASGNVLYTPGNASYMANEQMNWLASTALNFDNKSDKGWGVLIFLHFSGNPADEYGTTIEPRFQSIYGAFNRMLVAFSNKTTYSEEYTFADNSFYDLSISADWSRYAELESAPYLIGVLSGHRHWDYNYNWNGVQNIFTANQFCGEWYSDDRVTRIAGTKTQNLFDIFSIDLQKRKIRAIRYGAGLNCYGIGGDRFLPDGLSF